MPNRLSRFVVAAVVVASAVVLAITAVARADFQPGYYTHGSCAGTAASRVDPINFVYWDWGTWDRAVSQTQTHAGWFDNGGSSQYFFDHSNCYNMTAQRASNGVASTRFHIRLHPISYRHDSSLDHNRRCSSRRLDILRPRGRCQRSQWKRLRSRPTEPSYQPRKRRAQLAERVLGQHPELPAMRW